MTRIDERTERLHPGWITGIACVALALLLAGCKSSPKPAETTSVVPHAKVNTASKELSNSGKVLMDALNHPKTAFHYSYKGQENISDHYASDKSAKPQVGDVTMEADVSADELDVTATRGTKKEAHKAKKEDQLNWSLAQLALLSSVTGPVMDISVVSSMASAAGPDLVNGMAANKFNIDTTTLVGHQKAAFDVAKTILTLKDVKGTAWVAKDSGELVKFNLDVSRADDRGNTWQEHREGEVTPK